MVRCTFSPARAWRPAVVARLARTLGIAKKAVQHFSKVSACRRESNASNAALPRVCCSSFGVHKDDFASSYATEASSYQVSNGASHTSAALPSSHGRTSYLAPPRLTEAHSCVGSVQEPNAAPLSQPVKRQFAFRVSRKAALPNPSLKLRPNGVPPGPRGRAVYHQPRGPGVTPSVPA